MAINLLTEVKSAVEEYQCSGCSKGSNTACYQKGDYHQCASHNAGTISLVIGKIMLGLPKGFCRTGEQGTVDLKIFESYEKSWGYNMWNIPVWKHVNNQGHTIVRGLSPRINRAWVHIFLEDCSDKIQCQNITEDDIDGMD